MLTLCLFFVLTAAAGAALTARLSTLDGEDATGPLEAVAAWCIVTLFVCTAIDWLLAPFHAVCTPALLAAATLAAGLGLPTLRRELAPGGRIREVGRAIARSADMGPLSWVLVVSPVALWLAFAAWRGSLTPILSHDALSYHLPRAADIARTGTWRYLPVEDFRLAWFPAAYEMLLADVLVLTGRDQATSLVGIFCYLAGIAIAAALGERRWGTGVLAWFTALVWAGTPLALLHSVGHKNDTLVCVEITGAAMWGARWAVRGGRFALCLATLSAALAIGAKVTGLALLPVALVVLGPFGLWTRLQTALRGPRAFLGWMVFAATAVTLAGIAPYAAHLLHSHDPPMILQIDDPAAFNDNRVPHYGDFTAIPRFLYGVLFEPFSSRDNSVWIPWRHAFWVWPAHELYCSSYGRIVSVFVAFIPFALFASRHMQPEPAWKREAALTAGVLGAASVLLVAQRYHTDGFFAGMGRYLLFLPILAVEWGPARWIAGRATAEQAVSVWRPALRSASGDQDAVPIPRRLAIGALAIAAASFVRTAIDCGINDDFAPLSYVRALRDDTNTHKREPVFLPVHAATILDRFAGPHERVLVDAGFGAWIYPAFGAELTRPLDYLSPRETERAAQLAQADWVIVDRYWGVMWGSPQLVDMGVTENMGEGQADPRELGFAAQMTADRDFEVVFDDPRFHQLVLRRRARVTPP